MTIKTILETYVERNPIINDSTFRVYFQVTQKDNTSHPKAIDVTIKTAMEQPYKLAELLAIKYILLHTGYTGTERTGKDLTLLTSCGCIRKLQKQSTSNGDMVVNGRFLQMRFSEAQIRTSRQRDWAKSFDGEVLSIDVSDVQDKGIKTHIGELHLTRHAVDRFNERMKIKCLDKAWRRLFKLLTTSEWSLKNTPKLLKEGKGKTSESWLLRKDGAYPVEIVIVRSPQVNRVVTVIV